MVVTVCRPQSTASVMHEYTGCPSRCTVQAPHEPRSHTSLVPGERRLAVIAQRVEQRRARLDLHLLRFAPLIVSSISTVWNDDEDRNLRKKLGMFVEDPAQLWVPKPGVEVPYGSAEGERINSKGFRGPERGERRPGVLRVFALGDSSTFGMGVPYPDTWCANWRRSSPRRASRRRSSTAA
jgi:hypothetical protein